MTLKEAQECLRGGSWVTTTSGGYTTKQMEAMDRRSTAEKMVMEQLPCVSCKWSQTKIRDNPYFYNLKQEYRMCTHPEVRRHGDSIVDGPQSDDEFCYQERQGSGKCGMSGWKFERKGLW